MSGLSVIFSVLLLLSKTTKSHTVEVCNVVSADGTSVELFAGTYHSQSEINGQGGVKGAILLTPFGGGTQTRYDFTSTEADVAESPPSCSNTGVTCDCSRCTTYSNPNGILVWQKVVIHGLENGDYDVATTCSHAIECPWCNNIWSFTVTGSCEDGYILDNNGVCVDIDECANDNDNNCATNNGAVCVNEPGSYGCECLPGFVGDPYSVSGCTEYCITSCEGKEDGNYHSCISCNVFASCVDGNIEDNRACAGNGNQPPLEYDADLDACAYEGESQTCNSAYYNAKTVFNKFDFIGSSITKTKKESPIFEYITIIGIILFVLLNNVLIGLWCCYKRNANNNGYYKGDIIIDNDESNQINA